MIVKLGNAAPKAKPQEGSENDLRVTYISIPDSYGSETAGDVEALKNEIRRAHDPYGDQDKYGITRMEDVDGQKHEAYLAVTHPGGIWRWHSTADPQWVSSDNPVLAQQLSEHWQIPAEEPADVEDRYWTKFGHRFLAPGQVPPPIDLEATFTNVGRVAFASMMGSGGVSVGGTATAAAAGSLTTNVAGTLNQYAGGVVYCADSTTHDIVWGNIESNTASGSATVLTIDKWYAAGDVSTGTTPVAGFWFLIVPGPRGFPYVGLTASLVNSAAATSLTGEITSAGGGLVRKIAPWALTSGTSPVSYTLTPVYTANGSDSLPVTVGSIGVFNSLVVADTTDTIMWETELNVTATLSASGDQLTITETVTGS